MTEERKYYEAPEMEVISFGNEDVITTSGDGPELPVQGSSPNSWSLY